MGLAEIGVKLTPIHAYTLLDFTIPGGFASGRRTAVFRIFLPEASRLRIDVGRQGNHGTRFVFTSCLPISLSFALDSTPYIPPFRLKSAHLSPPAGVEMGTQNGGLHGVNGDIDMSWIPSQNLVRLSSSGSPKQSPRQRKAGKRRED